MEIAKKYDDCISSILSFFNFLFLEQNSNYWYILKIDMYCKFKLKH